MLFPQQITSVIGIIRIVRIVVRVACGARSNPGALIEDGQRRYISRMQDRNLALEVVRITEAAALASARLMGRGDRKHAMFTK